MIKNKIMNLLRKGNDTMKLRKMAMVFAVASMALVGGVACGVSDKDTAKTEKVEIAENTENNKEESSVEETTEEVVEETTTKEEVKETTKEEVKKDKEEVKKEQTSNTDKKKEENVKTEKPNTGNSNNTSSVNKPSNNKPNTGNSNSTSSVNKPSTGNNNSNTNKPSNSGVNNKPSTKPSTPVKPVHTHTHTWEEVTTTVYHEEQGHYENVVVKEAWTEKKPVYETQARDICNSCNADLTGTNIAQHVKEHMINGTDKGGHRTEYKKVQVGTETINHPAVTERKWVIDKAAWTEKVVTGYKCSDCGATK